MHTEEMPFEGQQAEVSPLDDFSAYQRWRQTGEKPEAKEESSEAAEEQPAKTAEESETSEEQEAKQEEPKSKGKGGFQRRIDRLTQEKRELEAQLEHMRRGRLAGEPAERPQEQKQSEAARPVKPDPAKFDSYSAYEDAHDKYVEDLADWKTDQKLTQAREAEQKQRIENAARKQAQQTLEQWEGRVDAARKAHDDFDEVMQAAEIPITPALQQALVESEHGAELAYLLAKDPEEAQRITKLSPLGQVRELGKLEAGLSKQPEKPKTKPVSKAPKPPSTVNGSSSPGVDIYAENTSFADYEKARREQLARK